MKRMICLFSFLLLALATIAQDNFGEAIRQGDRALRKGQYEKAINKYFAAEAFKPEEKKKVEKKVKGNKQQENSQQKEQQGHPYHIGIPAQHYVTRIIHGNQCQAYGNNKSYGNCEYKLHLPYPDCC